MAFQFRHKGTLVSLAWNNPKKVCTIPFLCLTLTSSMSFKSSWSWKLNPIHARGHFVPPHQNHSISAKRLGVGVTALCLFFLCIFRSLSPNVCCHGNHTTFGLISKTRISVFIQVFPRERNFLWDNLLCFRHHNNLRSLIKANIRTFTMETFQNIILPNYGHKH